MYAERLVHARSDALLHLLFRASFAFVFNIPSVLDLTLLYATPCRAHVASFAPYVTLLLPGFLLSVFDAQMEFIVEVRPGHLSLAFHTLKLLLLQVFPLLWTAFSALLFLVVYTRPLPSLACATTTFPLARR